MAMSKLVQAVLKQPVAGRIFRNLTGRILHKADIVIAKETIGTVYGSHTVRCGGLDASSIVYSFGIGEDVSFDLGVIERYGCRVHAFDPTPRSLVWAEANIKHPLLVFHPVGIAAHDGAAKFTSPSKAKHVSFSRPAGDHQSVQDSIQLKVQSLPSIMDNLSHDRLDLLKMDIEGFEYEVLDALLHSEIRPGQIAVEFHHGMYGYPSDATNHAVQALRHAGYALFHVSDTGREYSFCLSSLPQD
jgi:FkbM family methyltransferase